MALMHQFKCGGALGRQCSVLCRTLRVDSSYPSTISFASYYGSVSVLVCRLDFKSNKWGIGNVLKTLLIP